MKVLIADDHPVVRQGLRQMLAVGSTTPKAESTLAKPVVPDVAPGETSAPASSPPSRDTSGSGVR